MFQLRIDLVVLFLGSCRLSHIRYICYMVEALAGDTQQGSVVLRTKL